MLHPFQLLDPKTPPVNCTLLYTADVEWYEAYIHRLYAMEGYLIFHASVLKTKPRDQLEVPLQALPWLVDSIENGFWRKPTEGGLPREVLHVRKTIAGEDLRLGRSNNAGAENVPGFTLRNYSRHYHSGQGGGEQNDVIPDFIMKEGGFFQLLKDLSVRYERGELGT